MFAPLLRQLNRPCQARRIKGKSCFSATIDTRLYHYAVVRSDLSLGTICAQLVHAVGESCQGPVPSGTYAVVLAVKNEDELLRVHAGLEKAGIRCVLIREPDAPFLNQAMAVGVTPCERLKVKKVLGRLPLLKETICAY